MNKWLANKAYSFAGFLRGENISQKLEELETTQWYTRNELFSYQEKKFQLLIAEIKGWTPYYQEFLKEVNSLKDITKIPVLTKSLIREKLDGILHPNFRKINPLRYSSSGTTGEPLALYLDRLSIGYFHAAQWRGFGWYGITPGDRGVKIWGGALTLKSRVIENLKDCFSNRARISAFGISASLIAKLWNKCLQDKPEYLYGYASAIFLLASFIEETAIDGKELGLKLIVSTSEKLYDFQREKIKNVFGCPVVNEYGACESGVIAFECPNGNLHTTMENVYLEVSDKGKLLITNFNNLSMPFIRYEIGDVVSISDEQCACGRKSLLIKDIIGRESDFLVTPSGKNIHSEIFSYINRDLVSKGYLVKEFKVVQKEIDRVVVYLPEVYTGERDIRDFIYSRLNKITNNEIEIKFESIKEILPEISGKKRYFLNELRKS
ncbi:MAG: hypothetical protein ABII74_06705 [Elusimicrobiota bacterium]